MVQKKRLIQFYQSEYEEMARRKTGKLPRYSDLEKNVNRLIKAIKRTKPARLNQTAVEDFHRQLKNLICCASRKKREDLVQKMLEETLSQLVQMDLGFMLPEQKEGLNGECLAYLKRAMPGEIWRAALAAGVAAGVA